MYYTVDKPLRARGFQQITDLSSAVGLTIPADDDTGHVEFAFIQAIGQDVRYRDDGTDPTATVGIRLAAGDDIWYPVKDLTAIKFIEETATAELNVSYYQSR
jgi:hypothetical protein